MTITITHADDIEENPALFGDQNHLEYSQNVTFPELIFESLSGKKPNKKELKLFNLILNLCFDHGPNSPSGQATIQATKEGKDMGEAVAAGIAQINDTHGGAAQDLMKIIYQIKDGKKGKKTLPELVEEYINQGRKIPGFGHRIYKDSDPRAKLILEKCELFFGVTPYTAIASELEYELEKQSGKKLPLNIDGAIAVALCSFGWEPKLGKAIFIIARSVGLCAQFLNLDTSVV